MSASTTLTLGPVSSVENLSRQHGQYYQNHSNNNNNNSAFYQFPHEKAEEEQSFIYNSAGGGRGGTSYTAISTEDTLLLEKTSHTTTASTIATMMHKSNSYSGTNQIKPKSTILKQDSVNGRIATSLTDSDSDFGLSRGTYTMGRSSLPAQTASGHSINAGNSNTIPGEGLEENDAFLVSGSGGGAGSSANSPRRSSSRSHSKSRTSFCYRAHAFISRNWYLSYLVPLSILLALMFVAYLTRDYAQRLLYWIETQNQWVIFVIFMLLFILVSFPVIVGYFVLMITAGYLFGCIKGFLTVILGANVGIAIAHVTIKSFRHRIPMQKLIKNETGRAILRVISGPRAFKVVLFTRLTPIPFGIQNAIFGVSSINPRVYHSATFLGLLPAQTINVYLGSTLRSMHEVLNNHGTALTGYISFGVEVICGVALMFWVVQKARKELSETLLSDISTEGKLIDIQV